LTGRRRCLDDVRTLASPSRRSLETTLAIAIGLALLGVYAALACELASHGLAEFGYAPLVLEGMPWAPGPGFTWEQLWDHVYRLLLVGPALVLLSFGAFRILERRSVRWPAARSVALWTCAASILLVALVMFVVLRGRALVDDELTYRMQAGFLLDGRLTGPDVGYFPNDVFTIRTRFGYTGKYLFGEPLVQMIGTLFDVPALLHLPIYVLTLVAWHRTVRLATDATLAAWSTAFLALSPMLVMTSATAESQITALACIVAAGLGLEWIRAGRARAGALLLGTALGFGLTVRPQSVAPAGLVIGLAACWILVRRREWAAVALLGSASAFFLAAIGVYDRALSGSVFTLPWYLQCGLERYGFGHPIEFLGYEHTPLRALRNLAVVAVRFNGWWLGWPASLGVLGVWLWLGRPSRGCALWGAVGLAVILFEAGYWGPGVSDTGPIYHFELLLPASIVAANVVVSAIDRWRTATLATLLVHVALGTGSFMVVQIARIDRMVTDIHGDSDAALARIPGRALLVYETWASEERAVAWLSSAFPRRYRRDTDRVVTYPRQGAKGVQALRARYADRSCWYYHRDVVTEQAEVVPCDAAGGALRRRATDDSERMPMFIASTAYKRTSFDPWSLLIREIAAGHKHDSVKWPCCLLDEELDDRERSVPQDPRCSP
jgi:hypothetical protein